jgi:DNA-binding transcriptional LysR family regulator
MTSANTPNAALAENRLDLVVSPRPDAPAGTSHVIGPMDVVVAMSSEHRFAHRRASPSFADAAGGPLCALLRQQRTSQLAGLARSDHAVTLTPVVETRHANAAALLAADGLGLALVPISAVTAPFPGCPRHLRPRLSRDIIVLTNQRAANPLEASLRDELVTRGIPTPAVIAGQPTPRRRQ